MGQGVVLWYILLCITVSSFSPLLVRHLTTILPPLITNQRMIRITLDWAIQTLRTRLHFAVEHGKTSFRESVLVSKKLPKSVWPNIWWCVKTQFRSKKSGVIRGTYPGTAILPLVLELTWSIPIGLLRAMCRIPCSRSYQKSMAEAWKEPRCL